jgi:CMP-N-acetylneuraminic acid synthetase
MNITCVIGARGGSKGVIGKNSRPLLDKPLIAWSIEQALCCPEVKRVVVSTDDVDIQRIAMEYGAEVPFTRPAYLASDTAGKWDVWQHALMECESKYREPLDIFIDLDCTSPLRDVEDISRAIDLYLKSNVDTVFSVCKARKNPYFNMVEVINGSLEISKKTNAPIVRRQDAPVVFEHAASIYILNPNFLKSGTGLLSGRAIGYEMDPIKCVDIDSEFDFEFVEYLLNKKLKLSNGEVE